MLLLIFCLIAQEPALSYQQIPGFNSFNSALQRFNQIEGSFVVVHEGCLPLFIDRMLLVSRGMQPEQEISKSKGLSVQSSVMAIVKSIWSVDLVFLSKNADEKFFYRRLDTSGSEYNFIIFTCQRKLKNMKWVKMSLETPWQGLMIVVETEKSGDVYFGALP